MVGTKRSSGDLPHTSDAALGSSCRRATRISPSVGGLPPLRAAVLPAAAAGRTPVRLPYGPACPAWGRAAAACMSSAYMRRT